MLTSKLVNMRHGYNSGEQGETFIQSSESITFGFTTGDESEPKQNKANKQTTTTTKKNPEFTGLV